MPQPEHLDPSAYAADGGPVGVLLIHGLSGVLWLLLLPWTRLVHMLWFTFTRAYMGSEFGAVRHSRDW